LKGARGDVEEWKNGWKRSVVRERMGRMRVEMGRGERSRRREERTRRGGGNN
jgi:hypothetical protein